MTGNEKDARQQAAMQQHATECITWVVPPIIAWVDVYTNLSTILC